MLLIGRGNCAIIIIGLSKEVSPCDDFLKPCFSVPAGLKQGFFSAPSTQELIQIILCSFMEHLSSTFFMTFYYFFDKILFNMPQKSKSKLEPLNLGNETIGQRIARIRKDKKLTQKIKLFYQDKN